MGSAPGRGWPSARLNGGRRPPSRAPEACPLRASAAPRWRPRAAALAAGVAFTVCGGIEGACGARTSEESLRWAEGEAPGRVRVEARAAAVDVRSGPALRVRRWGGAAGAPGRLDGGATLVLPGDARVWMEVPPGTIVELQIDQGDVDVDVTADPSVRVDLRMGQGRARLAGARWLRARLGEGRLIAAVPAGGDAAVAVGRGDVDVHLGSGPWLIDVNGARAPRGAGDGAAGALTALAPGGLVRISDAPRPVAAR